MFHDNNWYGNRSIFARYCNKKDKKAFAGIQHGLMNRNTEKLIGKSFFYSIPFLCWNQRVEKILKAKKINATAVGSPFIYLHEMLKNKFIYKERGTLVFSTKSFEGRNRETDFDILIKKVESKFKGPYTISIFYLDINKDLSSLIKKNWKIISFGKRSKVNFLNRLYVEIQKHKNIVCTTPSTAFFYSAFLKKKTFLLLNLKKGKNTFNIDRNIEINNKKIEQEYPGILQNKLSIAKLYNIASKELGSSHIKTPNEISKLLGWNNYLKIFFSWFLSTFYYNIIHKNLKNL